MVGVDTPITGHKLCERQKYSIWPSQSGYHNLRQTDGHQKDGLESQGSKMLPDSAEKDKYSVFPR